MTRAVERSCSYCCLDFEELMDTMLPHLPSIRKMYSCTKFLEHAVGLQPGSPSRLCHAAWKESQGEFYARWCHCEPHLLDSKVTMPWKYKTEKLTIQEDTQNYSNCQRFQWRHVMVACAFVCEIFFQVLSKAARQNLR